MARIPYPDPATAPPEVKELTQSVPPLNIFRMLPHAPTLLRGFAQLGTAILSRATLDARLRELVILRVAACSPAPYEWQQHEPIARACGASLDEIEALRRGDAAAACFGAREQALLRLTDDLLAGPRASDATLATMRERFSDRELCEAILTVGYYMLVARFLETTGVDLEAGGGQVAADMVARLGRA